MKLKLKIKNLNKTKIIYILLAVIVISEIAVFGGLKYSQHKEEASLRKEVKKLEMDTKTLAKMTDLYQGVNGVDRISLQNKYLKKIKNKIGAEVTKVDIISKTSKRNAKFKYFKIQLAYSAINESSLRKLLAVLYLDDEIVAITNLSLKNIEIIVKQKVKKRKNVQTNKISSEGV